MRLAADNNTEFCAPRWLECSADVDVLHPPKNCAERNAVALQSIRKIDIIKKYFIGTENVLKYMWHFHIFWKMWFSSVKSLHTAQYVWHFSRCCLTCILFLLPFILPHPINNWMWVCQQHLNLPNPKHTSFKKHNYMKGMAICKTV